MREIFIFMWKIYDIFLSKKRVIKLCVEFDFIFLKRGNFCMLIFEWKKFGRICIKLLVIIIFG